jgi:ribosomal protein S18 acetylase RimI-like enzyme
MVDTAMDSIIRPFRESERREVIALWRECDLIRPANDPNLDIDRKLFKDPDHLIVADRQGAIVGSLMFGYDGHRGWLNYLAVRPDQQRRGLGRALVNCAEEELSTAGCAKVNLQIRTTNLGAVDFYRGLGYQVDDVVSMGRRLVEDHQARTAAR